MENVTREPWKGHQINIRAVPVRYIQTPASAPDGYVAVVQICLNGEVLADWHLPRYGELWRSRQEAEREAMQYAVRLINRGVFDEPVQALGLAS
ncbi:hypothetical protein CUJ89_34775 [Burkholderia pyrrocinia]|uniref:Uncharacterized protein n=1 Tax=Burkholderia pyrrocinia TaxID=60550 RepID=A0A2Z5N7P6_BURPY|nr:hypothetical protein [Burkholderia pyrrocinia]AXF25612.1 hypothetical protein CUJ89_34775 [Burkholderia pyrrocinia]